MNDATITTRSEFRDAVRAAIERAAEADVPEIVVVDDDFAEWPLGERAVVDALGRWASSGKRMVVFAHRFDELARTQVRFVAWRREWAHVVQCRADAELDADAVPTLLLVPGVVAIRLLDRVRCRGTVSSSPVDLVAARETVDALLQRSSEAFPVTTLGL